MLPLLHYERVGPLPEQRIEPRGLRGVCGSPRNTVPEPHLPFEVTKRGLPVELAGWNVGGTGDESECGEQGKAHGQRSMVDGR